MTSVNICMQILSGRRPAIDVNYFPECCGDEWADLITKCWEASPDLRPTMSEVVEAIKNLEWTDDVEELEEYVSYKCLLEKWSKL